MFTREFVPFTRDIGANTREFKCYVRLELFPYEIGANIREIEIFELVDILFWRI